MHTLPRLLAAAALLAAACSPATAPTASHPGARASSGGSPGASPASAAVRPLIVDTDLGSDDILALAVVLREPSVEVRAITVSGTGLVHCSAGLRNLRLLLAAFDAGDVPVGCGREVPGPGGRAFPDEWRAGSDALYGVSLPPAPGTSLGEDAPGLIARAAAASPVPPTILALGPWTNLADAFAADPALAGRIAGIHAMAGTVDAPGNVELGQTTAADGVEWNVGADPDAFAAVLALDVAVTLVPLDATDRIPVPADVVDRLAPDHGAAGADIAWELYLRNPFLTTAGNFLWDPLAALTLTDPGLVTWSDATLAMTAAGRQAGRLVRDVGGRPVRYASSSAPGAAIAALFAALRRGAPRPQPLVVTGELHVTWDGASCRVADGAPARAGTAVLRVTNAASGPAYVLEVTVTAPRSWADLTTFLDTFDPAAGEPPPAWLNQVAGSPLDAGAETVSIGTLPAGEACGVCATGKLPDLAIRISEPVTVGP